MKRPDLKMRILAAAMVAFMVFSVVAGLLVYFVG